MSTSPSRSPSGDFSSLSTITLSSTNSESRIDLLLGNSRSSEARAGSLLEYSSTNPRRILCCAAKVCLPFSTCGLLAIGILKDYGDIFNLAVTASVGFFGTLSVFHIIPKRVSDPAKDFLVDYSALLYLSLSQVSPYIPPSRMSTRLTDGCVNALLGATAAAISHTIFHSKPLAPPESTETIENRTIKVLCQTPQRADVICQLFKIGVGSAFFCTPLFTPSPPVTEISSKIGFIIIGNATGCISSECYRVLKQRWEREVPLNPQASLSSKCLKSAEKAKVLAIPLFSGLIGLVRFDTHGTDFVSGYLIGTLHRTDWLRFTTTNPVHFNELFSGENYKISKIKMCINIVTIFCLWSPFYVWQMSTNEPIDRPAMTSFTASCCLCYIGGGLLDTYHSILESTNRFLNTLFFYFYFSIPSPFIFIVVTQFMEIGNTALLHHTTLKTSLACAKGLSLGVPVGLHMARIQTKRLKKPNSFSNTFISLFMVSVSHQILKTPPLLK